MKRYQFRHWIQIMRSISENSAALPLSNYVSWDNPMLLSVFNLILNTYANFTGLEKNWPISCHVANRWRAITHNIHKQWKTNNSGVLCDLFAESNDSCDGHKIDMVIILEGDNRIFCKAKWTKNSNVNRLRNVGFRGSILDKNFKYI